MASKGNWNTESSSTRRTSEVLSSTTATRPVSMLKDFAATASDDENFLIGDDLEEDDDDDRGGGGDQKPISTISSSSHLSKKPPFMWQPQEYPPLHVHHQDLPTRPPYPHNHDGPLTGDVNNINVTTTTDSDPESFAVPTDAEVASMTAKECPPVLLRTKSSTSNRKSRARTASLLYYTSVEPTFNTPRPSQDCSESRRKMSQSKRFPVWAWRLLSRSLGIKVSPGDTPLLGTLLHMATLMFAFMFCVTGAWYIVYDVLSNYTRTTVLIGWITIVIGFGWVAIGIYANKLAVRLISNKKFGENVRMHSRTIFKVSSAVLLVLLCLVLLAVNTYHTYCQFQTHSCAQMGIDKTICLVNMVGKTGFGVLALVWNCLVGFVLLSVCRTHTIGIRRFMRELEADGKSYERYWKSQAFVSGTKHVDIDRLQTGAESDCGEPYVWYDGYPSDDDSTYYGGRTFTSIPKLSVPCQDEEVITCTKYNGPNYGEEANENQSEANFEQSASTSSIDKRMSNTGLPKVGDTQLLSNSDILLSYWKISWRMRVTSLNLQRWLASWIVFIVAWCGDYIIFWMSNKATLLGIVEFILPLLLLLLISSAFAEANAEGQRMIRCICPTEDRIFMLLFLNQQPLQMTVFNFALTYNAIVGVVLAFSVAFASKVIMDEVVK